MVRFPVSSARFTRVTISIKGGLEKTFFNKSKIYMMFHLLGMRGEITF